MVKKEIWMSRAAAIRWYTCFNPQGGEKTAIVQAGKTFMVTPLERQMNQDAVHAKEADPFTNGTFTLVTSTEDTQMDEIRSLNSVPDQEIVDAVKAAKEGNPNKIQNFIDEVDSHMTMGRIYEMLLVENAPQDLVARTQARMAVLEEVLTDDEGNPILQEKVTTLVGGGTPERAKDGRPKKSWIE